MTPEAAGPLLAGWGRLAALVEAGGVVAALLLAMSVLALGVAIAKAWQFARAGLHDPGAREALALIRAGRESDAARRLSGAGPGPEAEGLRGWLAARRAGLSEAAARDEGARRAEAALEALRAWLRPLETIAALAPLLGLFGTVLGMIDAFAAMEAAGARVDPAVLSGGIWTALTTTAVGLAVAMPAAVAHAWFDRRVERAERAVDDALAAAAVPLADAAPRSAPEVGADALVPRSV